VDGKDISAAVGLGKGERDRHLTTQPVNSRHCCAHGQSLPFLRYTTVGPDAANGALRLIVLVRSTVSVSAAFASRLVTLYHSAV
jgi:hypothetical protein